MSIEYIGEHLLPGTIGHIAVVLGFTASLFAAACYAMNVRNSQESNWKRLGRIGFALHGLCIFTIIGMLFYVMGNRYYEYYYVFSHISEDLSMRYILSAFWGGQEGSFLLWMFWHVVLGGILMWKAKSWESPVLATLCLIQAFLLSMILGIYFGEFKIGSNPTLLSREVMSAPIFAQADYLSSLPKFAKGLSPLLQNYWMTIHPPTLFLGFASVSIPFCYAMAGLWTGRHLQWLRPALRWALFSGAILGTGILMGAAWAYEALTFGGYWAWDPVENMSLVPWMVMLAGIHTHLVARATGRSIRVTYLFYILSFALILYSTFLTRSGVLGDTSAHAFTEMGLEWQLVIFMSFFALLGLTTLASKWNKVPEPSSEESVKSREFWMFVGSLVLMFGAVLITVSTSFPVINKVVQYFDPAFEGYALSDRESHHNRFQLWVGLMIGLLSGAGQFLYYSFRNKAKGLNIFWNNMAIAAAVAAVLTYGLSFWIDVTSWNFAALLFSGLFTIVANLIYLLRFFNTGTKAVGSTVSHVGFGILIIGVLASGLSKSYVFNPTVQRAFFEDLSEDDQGKNNTLFKNRPLYMSGYEVTYKGDTMDGLSRFFEIEFKKLDEQGVYTGKAFTLFPNIMYDKNSMESVATNPDTRHFASFDVFTMLAGAPTDILRPLEAMEQEDTLTYDPYQLNIGDTIFSHNSYAVIHKGQGKYHPDYSAAEGDLATSLELLFRRPISAEVLDTLRPTLLLRDGRLYGFTAHSQKLGIKLKLPEIAFEQLVFNDSLLDYQFIETGIGKSTRIGPYSLDILGFEPNAAHGQFVAQADDLATAVKVQVSGGSLDKPIVMKPLFIINTKTRNDTNLKVISEKLGLHLRFLKIDPNNENSILLAAALEDKELKMPVSLEMAERVPRSDYIALQTIIFPGINLVWVGSIMMMLGLAIGVVQRYRG